MEIGYNFSENTLFGVVLNDLVSSIVDEYSNEIGDDNNKNNIKLLYNTIEDNNNIIIVEADRHRITQVISNLMDNAIKFTKEGGGIVSIIIITILLLRLLKGIIIVIINLKHLFLKPQE
jgi:signal transduction histidine kinase